MRASLILMGGVSVMFGYACTLDFDQFRNPEANPATTTGPGSGGGGEAGMGPGPGGGGSTGGMGGSGGAAGGMGGAGGGANPDCPATEPNGDACDDSALRCFYDGNSSHCECWGGQFDCDNCPATNPGDGSNCNGFGNQRCFFGSEACHCSQFSNQWNCAECPASEPSGNCGGFSGLHCAYGATECTCGGGPNPNWDCQ